MAKNIVFMFYFSQFKCLNKSRRFAIDCCRCAVSDVTLLQPSLIQKAEVDSMFAVAVLQVKSFNNH